MITFLKSSSKQQDLSYMIEHNRIESLRNMLHDMFKTPYVYSCGDNLILDLADTLAFLQDLSGEIGVYESLNEILHNSQDWLKHYNIKYEKAMKAYQKTYVKDNLPFRGYYNHPEDFDLNDQDVLRSVRDLDKYYDYKTFITGYNHDRFEEYELLASQTRRAINYLNDKNQKAS